MKLIAAIAPFLLLSTLGISPALTQISAAPDGINSAVTQTGNTFNITGGTQAGSNLFHSFQQFGLNPGQIATFLSNPTIANILGRVTGGEASIIHGQIQVSGSNANLYLMNPAGIVFGASASLNVPGSFTATTANGIGIGNSWFNATGANNYATLIGTPDQFAFTTSQPGAIVNAGNLAVGQGHSITLFGGTVINTGTLTAPGGTVTIATVTGEKLVRISQAGSLLSLDLPTETKTNLNPTTITPIALPALLTGGNIASATGLTVENGTVKLTGSTASITLGDVVAKTIETQTATLSAANNLTLLDSQLRTTSDLTLQANNTVIVRDSAANPVTIQAGGNLTMQGDRGIDIFALNHPNSGLVSGGNTTLRSNGPMSSDAHYFTGGSLKFEQLNGNPGNVFSLYDPIILAAGDVVLGDYTGASLHILAGGSVTLGNVVINAPGSQADTINPANPDLFLASLAPITRADGITPLYVNVAPTLDSDGNVQRLPTAANQLIIDGRNPTLDVRAGIDWSKLDGFPGNSIIPIPLPNSATPPNQPTFTAATSADITINSIQVNGVFGDASNGITAKPGSVLLTNQYHPNVGLTGGLIQVTGTVAETTDSIRCFNCSTFSLPDGVGKLTIDSRRTINLGNIDGGLNNSPEFIPQTGSLNVDLNAVGNITTRAIGARSTSDSSPPSSVVLNSATGNIQVHSIVAGSNGVNIRTPGLFQAIRSYFVGVSFDDANGSSLPAAPETPVYEFLISKGITSDNINDPMFLRYDESIYQTGSIIIAGTSSPFVSIQYGDASRVLINENPRTSGGKIVVRGGEVAFVMGSKVINPLVPVDDPYVVLNGNYEPVTIQNYNSNALYFNQEYAPLLFGSTEFPRDINGLAGSITIIGGTDSTLYSSFQNRSFPAVVNSTNSNNPINSTEQTTSTNPTNLVNTNDSGSAVLGNGSGSNLSGDRVAGRQQFQAGEDGQIVQSQLNQQTQTANCNPTTTIASASVPESRSGSRVGNPCATTGEDAQILKILGDDSRPNPSN